MYSSKIKDIWEKIHSTYNIDNSSANSMKNKNNILNIPNIKENNNIFTQEDYLLISDFLIQKFEETSKIFSKFSFLDFFSFIYLSSLNIYKEGDLIFSKDEECNSYIFILNGDINLFTDISLNSSKIESAISSGNIYGHLIKDKYKYYIRARNNTSIIIITKANFDELIMSINKRIKTFKSIFIKKFFPSIRIFSDDLIHNILTYFERIQYQKYDKIFSKGNYNEYIYLIISGEVSYCLKPKSFFVQNKKNFFEEYDYILLEKLGRGDLIGINSALNSVKNEYNCIVLSNLAELYRISKGDFLYYFGGLISDAALNLKSIGDLQDMSISKKIEYLKNNNFLTEKNVNNFCLKIPEKEKEKYYNKGCLIIYEDPIDNILFEKWKTIKIGLSDFKNKLIGQKKKRIDESKKNNFDIHEKDIDNIKNRKDIGIIKKEQSYSLYRVANGRLNLKLNNSQMKSLNKLNKLCGIKTSEKDQNNIKIKNIGDNIQNNYNDNKSNIKLDDEENNI